MMTKMMETTMTEWVDPHAGWADDLRGKKVLMTVQPDGKHGSPTGFVIGTVTHQSGEVLHVSLGKRDLEIHLQYVHRVLLDDEPVPDTLDGLPRLHF